MQYKINCLLLLLCFQTQAQFQFSGKVNNDYTNAIAYLSVIDNYNKTNLFLVEHILQECHIDSLGTFNFYGDFLKKENKIYNIHIDNCKNEITDYKHMINHCDDSLSILFIANNTDTVYFPLNELSQALCSISEGKLHTKAIRKIDSLQETLLNNLRYNRNDIQRKITYQNSFNELQKFSKTFKEPIAELYAFQLYAKNNSIYNSYYLNDLKKSDYYLNLLNRLEKKQPNTTYTLQFKHDLLQNKYPLLNKPKKDNSFFVYFFAGLLFISLLLNFILYRKQKTVTIKKINYKDVLTPQEQKVLKNIHLKLSNKEIANTLFISISTVKTHINSIYSKLNISSRKETDNFF